PLETATSRRARCSTPTVAERGPMTMRSGPIAKMACAFVALAAACSSENGVTNNPGTTPGTCSDGHACVPDPGTTAAAGTTAGATSDAGTVRGTCSDGSACIPDAGAISDAGSDGNSGPTNDSGGGDGGGGGGGASGSWSGILSPSRAVDWSHAG